MFWVMKKRGKIMICFEKQERSETLFLELDDDEIHFDDEHQVFLDLKIYFEICDENQVAIILQILSLILRIYFDDERRKGIKDDMKKQKKSLKV